jgi:hypothetical protein
VRVDEPVLASPTDLLERDPSMGRLMVRYRRRLPEHTIVSLWSACLIEGLAIGLLTLPDLAMRVFFSSALLGIAMVLVYLTLFRSALTIKVHEYGVRMTRGSHTESAFFSNVTRIYTRGLGPDQKISLELQLGDKRVLLIEGWDRELVPACEAILERATGVIAPRVFADFYAGEYLDFGAVRLSRRSIAARRARMSLQRVASATVRSGRFTVIDDAGQTFVSMECFEVANLEALMMLLSRIGHKPVLTGRST